MLSEIKPNGFLKCKSFSSEKDETTYTSLRARRIRLLAYLAFIYPINVKNGKFSICEQVLPEEQLLSRVY